jgi:hypothetical protein
VIARRLAGLLLSLWAGSLVTVCGLAAPSAFAVLERSSAGQLAAQLFFAETLIGAAVAIAVVLASKVGGFVLARATWIAVALGALAPVASEIVLGPMMRAAKAAGDMGRFGALHGISAALFALACVCAVTAVWRFNRPAV